MYFFHIIFSVFHEEVHYKLLSNPQVTSLHRLGCMGYYSDTQERTGIRAIVLIHKKGRELVDIFYRQMIL